MHSSELPDSGLPYPWETCMTMAGSWSYVPNDVYKPPDELLKKLVDGVGEPAADAEDGTEEG